MSLTEVVEDRRLLEQLLREQEQEAAITAAPAKMKYGKDHVSATELTGVIYQKCGGGRRIIRKKIGGD